MHDNEVPLKEITAFLDNRLQIDKFPGDHSNNGLQAEASKSVRKIVCGVDACMELFIRAASLGAVLVVVHHVLRWGSEPRRLAGVDGEYFAMLFRKNMSLYACHLPLDAHPEIGNNALLCRKLPLKSRENFFCYDRAEIRFSGEMTTPVASDKMATFFNIPSAKLYGKQCMVNKVAVVSGGAGRSAIIEAAAKGCQMLITGEMEHVMYHTANEYGVAVLALGHYASETFGVNAVTNEAAEKCGLDFEFIDIPTGL